MKVIYMQATVDYMHDIDPQLLFDLEKEYGAPTRIKDDLLIKTGGDAGEMIKYFCWEL
jgi:hypothetical protein